MWVATALIAAAAMLAGALGEGVTDTVASSRSVLCIQVIRARVWLTAPDVRQGRRRRARVGRGAAPGAGG